MEAVNCRKEDEVTTVCSTAFCEHKHSTHQAFSQVNIETLANFIYFCCNGCQCVHKSRRDAFHIIIETTPSKLYADAEGMILISENLVYGVFLLYLSLYFNLRAWKKKNPPHLYSLMPEVEL
jgi:hypothetical protein